MSHNFFDVLNTDFKAFGSKKSYQSLKYMILNMTCILREQDYTLKDTVCQVYFTIRSI